MFFCNFNVKKKSGDKRKTENEKKNCFFFLLSLLHPAHPASSATDPPNTMVRAVMSMPPRRTGSTLES